MQVHHIVLDPTLQPTQGYMSLDVCLSVAAVVGPNNVDGAQQIGNIWQIHLKTNASRIELLIKVKLNIGSKEVRLYDQNPLYNKFVNESREKITIKELPFHVTNDEIEKILQDKGIELLSYIMMSKVRDDQGNLTEYKNGDRFMYVKGPIEPVLPRIIFIQEYRTKVYHDGQFKDNCKTCKVLGHNDGDDRCPARNIGEPILPFRSHNMVLSNYYPCELEAYDMKFKSLEHAYQWKKATEAGEADLANRIEQSQHAGKAKKLSEEVPAEFTKTWETSNTTVMRELISLKATQIDEFKTALIQSSGKHLAEATSDTFWASGLPPKMTEIISPEYWPGENTLGKLLMSLRSSILETEGAEANNNSNSFEQNYKMPENLILKPATFKLRSLSCSPNRAGRDENAIDTPKRKASTEIQELSKESKQHKQHSNKPK